MSKILPQGAVPSIYTFSHNCCSVENGENLKGNDSIGGTHFSLNHDSGRKGEYREAELSI